MSTTVQLILYGVLIIILGVVGYYVGASVTAIGAMGGAGIGVAAGIVISGIAYYMQGGEEVF